MKKIITCLLTTLGLTTAYGQAQEGSTYEVDEFLTASGKTMKLHALVHASIWMDVDDKVIMVDPVTKLGEKTIDFAALPKADFILITHDHYDHLDSEAIRLLTKDNTQIIMNKQSAETYRLGIVMENGDKMQLTEDITIEAVPAYNTTKGHKQFHPKGRDNGYILTIDGLRIYIAGDTEDIPEMKNVRDIDIAFLPCNQPYTMTPEQVVKVAQIIKPKVLFPYHYGETDVRVLPALLKDSNIDVRIRHFE